MRLSRFICSIIVIQITIYFLSHSEMHADYMIINYDGINRAHMLVKLVGAE